MPDTALLAAPVPRRKIIGDELQQLSADSLALRAKSWNLIEQGRLLCARSHHLTARSQELRMRHTDRDETEQQ